MHRLVLGAAASVLLAACGSAASQSTSSSVTTSQTASAATTTSTATQTTTTAEATATQATTTAAASNVRLPAKFTVAADGALSPRTISAPTRVAIALTIVSSGGRSHHVVVKSTPPHALTVPGGGRVSAVVDGLKRGSYAIEVDGVTRGTLVIGASPGP
jgi:hypothetical protein